MKVALVTSERFAQLTHEDASLVRIFTDRGIEACPRVWTDAAVDWSRFDCAAVRSTWDYHLRSARFSSWIGWASSCTKLANAPELLKWNMHKQYLLELSRAGINIVPTVIVRRGEYRSFHEIREALDTEELVVKPAVSASAYRTTFFTDGHASLASGQSTLDELVAERDTLVQPFLSEVYDPGERSLIFFDERFSHAVLRPPLSQGAAGGERRERRIEPSSDEVAFGSAILARLKSRPAYARVDLVPLRSGDLALTELELIEPSLYFSHCPSSADAFVDAISRVIYT